METSLTAAKVQDFSDEAKNKNETLDLSPHKMADAIMAEAMAERSRLTQPSQDENSVHEQQDSTTVGGSVNEGPHRKSGENSPFSRTDIQSFLKMDEKAELKKLMEMEEVVDDDEEKKKWIVDFLSNGIESLVQEGLKAFHSYDSVKRELSLAKEELHSKYRELQRLRSCEESSRTTITNLLRAVEKSKSDTRDLSRHVQVEAKLRSDITTLRAERNEVAAFAASLKRKLESLEEDLRVGRMKLSRMEQEKVKAERENRAAISLAKTVGSEKSSDVDFYKRKVSDLQGQLSSQRVLNAEQKTQIDELRRQQERSMSQHRLATMRAEGHKGRQNF